MFKVNVCQVDGERHICELWMDKKAANLLPVNKGKLKYE